MAESAAHLTSACTRPNFEKKAGLIWVIDSFIVGLIVLILIDTASTAYAFNRATPNTQVAQFLAVARITEASLQQTSHGANSPLDARGNLMAYLRTNNATPQTSLALAKLISQIADEVRRNNSLNLPTESVRSDMYVAAAAIRYLTRDKNIQLDEDTGKNLSAMKKLLDSETKSIPLWVKVALTLSLSVGTLIVWKCLVIIVSEKNRTTHPLY